MTENPDYVNADPRQAVTYWNGTTGNVCKIDAILPDPDAPRFYFLNGKWVQIIENKK